MRQSQKKQRGRKEESYRVRPVKDELEREKCKEIDTQISSELQRSRKVERCKKTETEIQKGIYEVERNRKVERQRGREVQRCRGIERMRCTSTEVQKGREVERNRKGERKKDIEREKDRKVEKGRERQRSINKDSIGAVDEAYSYSIHILVHNSWDAGSMLTQNRIVFRVW